MYLLVTSVGLSGSVSSDSPRVLKVGVSLVAEVEVVVPSPAIV